MIVTISPRFASPLCYKSIALDGGKHIRLYEPCGNDIRGANALVRVHEPPAGPLKFDFSFGDVTFPKISVIFRCHARTYPAVQLFPER